MFSFARLFLAFALFLLVTSCGRSKPSTLVSAGGVTTPTAIATYVPVPTYSPAPTCNDFQVKAEKVDAGSTIVGVPIKFRISATYCNLPGYAFRIHGEENTFTSSVEIQKTPKLEGRMDEAFPIEVFATSQPAVTLQSKFATISVTILSDKPFVDLGAVPVLAISRLAPITAVNQAMQIRISVEGKYDNVELNGQVIPLYYPAREITVPIYPMHSGTSNGIYIANVAVNGAHGKIGKIAQFQAPLCWHSVTALNGNSLSTSTSTNGVVSEMKVNGIAIPLTNPYAPVPATTDVGYAPGNRTSTAVAKNAYGDSVSCSASYKQNHTPIVISHHSKFDYQYTHGWVTDANTTVAVSGGGAGSAWGYWSLSISVANQPIRTSAVYDRGGNCGPNEVVVGRIPSTFASRCSPLAPGLELYGHQTLSIGWDFGQFAYCPAGKVMVGNNHFAPGMGAWGQLDIICANIKWSGE